MATKPAVADSGLEVITAAPTVIAGVGLATTIRRFCRKKPLGAAGAFLMLIMVVTAIFAEPLSTYDPIATDAADTLAPPSHNHWLGSDPPCWAGSSGCSARTSAARPT